MMQGYQATALPDFRDHTGEVRVLGSIPSRPSLMAALPRADEPLVPEAQWREFDLWPDQVKVKDQDGKGACFPAGTRVRMEDGSERAIEDVRLLDRVVTAEGRIGQVVRTMARTAASLVRLSLYGHSHLRCTDEHPILTERGYVAAGELLLGDWVALPRYMPKSNGVVVVAEHMEERVMTTRAGKSRRHFNAPEGRTKVDVILTPIPDVVGLTPGSGRIFGLFLAEGATTCNKLVWTFAKDEEDTLVRELVGLLKSEWGLEAHLQHRPNNSINVVVYGGAWAKFFESLCATGSGSKRLHRDLTQGPEDFLRAVLFGWLAGDGHVRRNEVQGVTISRDLALGMYDIAQGLGLRPSIRRYQSPTYEAVKHRHARWEVTIPSGTADTYRCRMDDTHIWRKVTGVEREEFHGHVFNIEVEGDNSYVAEGIGVHNCNGHATASGGELVRAVANMPHVDLSAWGVYAPLCNGFDRGSSIMDAFALIRDKGIPPEANVEYGTINPRRIAAEAWVQAKRYRLDLGARQTTQPQIMSAVQRLQPLNLSICVGMGFDNLDAEGIARLGARFDNHAVTAFGGAKRARNGKWIVKILNSWGTRWGMKGFFWVYLSDLAKSRSFECYSVAAFLDDPAAPSIPTFR